MKRIRILSLLVILALLLGVSGVVSAQEPEFIQYFNVDTNPAYVGDTVNYSSQMYGDIRSLGATQSEPCVVFYVPASSSLGTDTGTLSAQTGVYTLQDSGNLTNCDDGGSGPANPGDAGGSYDRYYSQVTQTGSNQYANWTLNMPNTLSSVTAADYNVEMCINFGSFSGNSWVCSELDPDLTVNAAATTRYVANNSAQCQGYTPCDTGTSGLATALADTNAQVIIVLGAYQANPNSNPSLLAGDTLKGQGGATIGFDSTACGGGSFLTASGAGSTIQDLTFDGTCSGVSTMANGIYVNMGAGGDTLILQDVTIKNFNYAGPTGNGVYLNAGTLSNTDVTYDSNYTGAYVNAGAATFDDDTFTDNTTGVAVSGGTATVTNSSFDGNTTGVNHTAGTANLGTAPGNGNTIAVPTGGTGISSAGGTIKDNTISGGNYGIYLTAAGTNVYANTVSGASTDQIECSGAFAGAGFSYIGGNYGGGGTTTCTDGTDQLGSPIESWTDTGTLTLNECTVTGDGPIFNLGNNAPFGFTPPLGRDSKYYAVTSSATSVVISVGTRSFRMLMAGTGCNPMTSTCWESAANGRLQVGAGYFFGGSQDPTAITLSNVTTQSPRQWLPVALVVAALVGVGGALVTLRRRRYS